MLAMSAITTTIATRRLWCHHAVGAVGASGSGNSAAIRSSVRPDAVVVISSLAPQCVDRSETSGARCGVHAEGDADADGNDQAAEHRGQ